MPAPDRVAIVGMAARFPGAGADLGAFWHNVASAADCSRDVPPGRWLLPPDRCGAGLPAGLVAKALGLGGGTFTLDAACASSLYALKLACDELRAGRADAMLAGGANGADSLYTQMGFAQLRALSQSGRCSP